MVSAYIYYCLDLFTGIYIFLVSGTCTFVHGSLLYMHICVTTAVSVHTMYYKEQQYIYVHTIYHDISSIMLRQLDQ